MKVILTYFIALVWIVNGLFCKLLNFAPRHEQIVERILGLEYSRVLIVLIGILEVLMAFWIFSRVKKRLNAIFQITIVLVMNVLEFLLTPDLLLWGKFNIIFAAFFVLIVYYNEFYLNEKES